MNDPIATLHKRRGVRRRGLRGFIGPELCARWGIGNHDDVLTVREKVVDRICEAIRRHVDEDLWDVALAWFNAADEDLADLNFEERVERISSRRGPGSSRSTLKRRMEEQLPKVLHALRHDDLGGDNWASRSNLRETMRLMHEPNLLAEASIQLFRKAEWFVPTAEGARFHLAHPRGDDPWLCAFSSQVRYQAYQKAAGAPWRGEPLRISGAALVRELHQRFPTAGLLCDPSDRVGGPVTQTLCLPAHLVAKLSQSGPTDPQDLD